MTLKLIENQRSRIINKGFGRLPAIDHRDRRFALPSKAQYTPTRANRYWYTGPVLNQGDTSQCVAYAGEGLLMAGPVTNKPYQTPFELYRACQQVDEWPGDDYDGTSVRALMKVFKDVGLISEYNWAADIQSMIEHVLEVGPMVMGTDWYSGMLSVDIRGFVHAEGSLEGGHAYLLPGINLRKRCPDGSLGAFRIQNSWDTDWGQKGRAWLSFTDADKLLRAWGEAATPKELKFKEREPEGSEAAETGKPAQMDIAA